MKLIVLLILILIYGIINLPMLKYTNRCSKIEKKEITNIIRNTIIKNNSINITNTIENILNNTDIEKKYLLKCLELIYED